MINFKKSLFGYSKIEVWNYINNMSENYSSSLYNKDRNMEEKINELNKKIEKLQEENAEIKSDLKKIATAILYEEKNENKIFNEYNILKENIKAAFHNFEDEINK